MWLKKLFTGTLGRKEAGWGYLLILPCLLFVFVRTVYPSFAALWISLNKVDVRPGFPREFVGLVHWIDLIYDPVFWLSLKNTLYFSVANIGIGFVVALFIAILLNQEFRGRNIMRVLLIIPWAIPYVSNGLIWAWIYAPSYGVLNSVLTKLGLISQNQNWLGDSRWAMLAIIFAQTWKDIPFMTIMILAALQTFPESLREVARIDGASRAQIFFRLVLPYLKLPLLFVIILQTINAVKVFESVYVLTRGGPGNTTRVLFLYSYERSFQFYDLGYGAALSFVIFIVIIILMAIYLRLFSPEISV